MTTIRDLAQRLGLSITTVSRALDDYQDVSALTRAKVRAAAEATGYRPNAAARRLRRGRTDVVTMVLPTTHGGFDEPLYIQLLASMGPRFVKAGYDLTLLAAPPGEEETRTYRRIVEGQRADGIIVVRARQDDARIRYLLTTEMPFVVMGRSNVEGHYSLVDGDGQSAFHQATQYLLKLGHRRIIHLAAPSAFTFATLRRKGYEAAMHAADLEPKIFECSAESEPSERIARELLESIHRPTAFLCATDRMAYGVMNAAHSLGLRIPDDLSVMGHDNLPASATSVPPLTTMELPLSNTGERLAMAVLQAIKDPLAAPLHDILPVNLIERGSTAPPPEQTLV
jgi:LacI family transcriptional regulator